MLTVEERAFLAEMAAKHLPGQHNQLDHGHHGAGGLDDSALVGLRVFTADDYEREYGDVIDERMVTLGEDGAAVGARYFESGDIHVVFDLPDGRRQPLEEMVPDSMRQLADDIDGLMYGDLDGDRDLHEIAHDADSAEHGFYVARYNSGDIRIQPPGEESEPEYLELTTPQADQLIRALNRIADDYDDYFPDVEIINGAKGRKHLPGLHDQRTHGRHSAANRARQAAQELGELRESLARAQERMGGRPLAESHQAADRRLLGERLRRHGDSLGPSDVLERTERQAAGRNQSEALQARSSLRTAKFALAHDRADVLAELEQIVSINEGFDDPAVVGRQLRVALGRNNLTDDPRLTPLMRAVETGDTAAVLDAINEIAGAAGLRRIGGDQRLGPDQVIAFDPKQHQAVRARPRDGQLSLLVRPGYVATVDGQESALPKATVDIAEADDIARAREAEARLGRKHLRGLHDQSAHGRRRNGSAASSAARWITPDQAMEMRSKMLAGDPWTFEQQDALNRYVGSAYGEMNGLLRNDRETVDGLPEGEKAEFSSLIRDAHAGMRPTTEPVKVKRFVGGFESFGLDMTTLTRDEAVEALKAMKGKTLQEPGFMSTSLLEDYGKDTWSGKVRIELDVPPGAQGAYLNGDVGFPKEHELLLAPGTRFEVTDVVIDPPRNTVRGRVVVP